MTVYNDIRLEQSEILALLLCKSCKFEKSVNFNDEGNSSRRRGGFMSFYRSEADMMAQYLLYIIVS